MSASLWEGRFIRGRRRQSLEMPCHSASGWLKSVFCLQEKSMIDGSMLHVHARRCYHSDEEEEDSKTASGDMLCRFYSHHQGKNFPQMMKLWQVTGRGSSLQPSITCCGAA